jgi:two-component system sensor histidine kinase TctE
LKSQNRRPNSLRQLLLAWLLPGVALLLVASGTSAYFVAWRNATLAYDRSLLNLAIALANQVHYQNGHLKLDLQPQGQQILMTDKFDRIYYAVFGPQGELLGGDEALFPKESPSADMFDENYYFFDSTLHGREVRGVILLARQDGQELTVLVGETLTKREAQVGEILLSIIVPEFLLAAATIAVIMFGIGVGLRPLSALRDQLARRSPQDLRPVGGDRLPIELQPLVIEINQLMQRLDMALGAQRHFVSDASHQLRTPIAALQAQVESTLRERNGDPQLDPILSGVKRLAHLVNQLLALARAEPGSIPASTPVDLKALIYDYADRWMPLAIERNIDLGFEVESAIVKGSPLLLGELLTNLVDNAIRYTPAGGRVTVRCFREEKAASGANVGAAVLRVEDSGEGIPPEMRERVFERFFRLGEGTADGCGLGLAVVRQIAQQHGAEVRIDDMPGGGALVEVRFRLPLANQ